MRSARRKVIGKGCYYHLINRISGPIDELLFTDVDKEFAFKLLENLDQLYSLELISACIMGNHYHLVLYQPEETLSPEDAAMRHNAYYCDKEKPTYAKWHMPLDPKVSPQRCEEMAENLNDISHFMGVFQQRFAHYINRVHKRRGRLWADRFKNLILEGPSALWNCVKYIELNPVRAGIVGDPADYRFCSWGRFKGSGKHSFEEAFARHMKTSWIWADTANWTFEDVCQELSGEFARIIKTEDGVSGQELLDEVEKARKGDSMPVKFLRRTRHWSDGAIIGSKAFVQEMASRFDDPDHVKKKRFARGELPEGGALYCFRQLQL